MTTITYPKLLPEPLKSSGYKTETQKITEFDHSNRYRKTYCGTYYLDYSFIFSKEEMIIFREFWYITLNHGTNTFLADWDVEGSDTEKEFKFNTYQVQRTQNHNFYEVKIQGELKTPITELTKLT